MHALARVKDYRADSRPCRMRAPVSELFAIPVGGRVIVGGDGFSPTAISIMRRDCGTTLASYSLEPGTRADGS